MTWPWEWTGWRYWAFFAVIGAVGFGIGYGIGALT